MEKEVFHMAVYWREEEQKRGIKFVHGCFFKTMAQQWKEETMKNPRNRSSGGFYVSNFACARS